MEEGGCRREGQLLVEEHIRQKEELKEPKQQNQKLREDNGACVQGSPVGDSHAGRLAGDRRKRKTCDELRDSLRKLRRRGKGCSRAHRAEDGCGQRPPRSRARSCAKLVGMGLKEKRKGECFLQRDIGKHLLLTRARPLRQP